MRKLLLASAVSAIFSLPMIMSAQTAAAAEPAPSYTLTANVGIFSDYIFRGLTQTNSNPAVQGGLDFTHSSGFYAGTWLSNISWLTDFGAYKSASLEWDFYGGYRGSFGNSDFGYDVGLLQYYYPGTVTPGATKADTLEGYASVSWKWLSAKYSYSLGNKTFGVPDSRGTGYLDISANYPLTDKVTLMAHYGNQKYKGTAPGAADSNDSLVFLPGLQAGAELCAAQELRRGRLLHQYPHDREARRFLHLRSRQSPCWQGRFHRLRANVFLSTPQHGAIRHRPFSERKCNETSHSNHQAVQA